MGENDDDDPLQNHLEELTRRVERIVGSKLHALSDQLLTLASENEVLNRRINDMQNLVSVQASNHMFLVRQLTLITEELDALEKHLGNTDPVIARILLKARLSQSMEIEKRGLDG